jgi:hypothetical protein
MPSDVDLQVALLKELEATKLAAVVRNLIEVSIPLVEAEAGVTGVRLVAALVGTYKALFLFVAATPLVTGEIVTHTIH